MPAAIAEMISPGLNPFGKYQETMHKFAWLRNNEFSCQALAGVNPVNIQLLREFPILSKLDPAVYGPPESAITKDLIEQEKWLEKCICHVS
ncbi:hypothetical protein LOK49_LG02G02696 [Camellia lanceoleosa]|uniref:Uncharacterized protein n=1 Tax=Camellia lanceoleosa TaxID=1840588 RepID=A0ACC0IHU3_9ERIC|nr:hypothetical protein LOK49_LG02G02696 [Camellia lanceoleosa]